VKCSISGRNLSVLLVGLLSVFLLPVVANSAEKKVVKLAREIMLAAEREYLNEYSCPFSVVGAVMRAGTSPKALAAFVRKHIAYQPYVGSERGPQGTLAARAGSDWDRALLLRAMLAEAGYVSELVVLPRSKAAGKAVVGSFLAGSCRARTLGAAQKPDLRKLPASPALLKRHGITINNRKLKISAAVTRWQRMLDDCYDAGWSGSRQIKSLIARQARPLSFPAWQKRLMTGAAQRVLLFLPHNKTLLDVSPDAKPASAKGGKRLKVVPPARVAVFDLRVILKTRDAKGKIKAVPVLKHQATLASMFGKNLRLQVVPEASQAPGKEMKSWKPVDFYNFLTTCKRFQVVLESGEFWKASLVFDLSGHLFTVSSDGRIEAAKGLGKGVGKALGGMFGGGGGEAKPDTSLDSLELEIDLVMPGGEKVAIRRILFGKLKKDVSPLVHSDIAVFPGPMGPQSVQWLGLKAAARNFELIAKVLAGGNPESSMRSGRARVMQRMLNEWQLARLGLADRIMSSSADLAFYGGAAVVIKTATMMPVAASKRVKRRTVIDVACDRQCLVPRKASAAVAAFDANLLLGAASTACESWFIREKKPGSMAGGTCAEFKMATISGQKAVVVLAPKLGAVKPTALVRWAIAANQKRELLIFPYAKGPRSWWSIDPGSGVTLGRGGGGEGMAASEYLNIIKVNLSNLKCMVAFFGDFIKGTKRDDALRAWLMCITGTDNPGTYVGAGGGIAGTMGGYSSGFSTAGDVIGGVWDVFGMSTEKK
jgi:hypothetical protein